MKKLTIVLMILLIMVSSLGAVACSGGKEQDKKMPESPSTPTLKLTPTPTPTRHHSEFTLSDAPQLLDLSSLLPGTFEHIDAASEGMSNADIGLGPVFSEVQVFLSEEPYQLIYMYLCVVESRIEKAASDALLRDDDQIESILLENIRAGAAEEGIYDMKFANTLVSHPNVGDIAALGQGTIEAYGASSGFDILFFRRNDTYIFLCSVYSPNESFESVELIGTVLDDRLLNWGQY
ncbi:MAG: hypothetical protein GY861_15365 [bacterium]|nr:hypothetical protein [bacterium]